MIFIDAGNDEPDPMWLRMIDRANQIVVDTTTRNDRAEASSPVDGNTGGPQRAFSQPAR
ncbi:hypothetical protein [Specibacter sp. NPDC078692]|uniref:hypothetical protein n=1 Tax=Specibacter sp. NPDC078692 TaxID=3155818 RepID=UPI00341C7D3F